MTQRCVVLELGVVNLVFELVGKGVGGVGCGVECVGGNVLHMVENVSALFSYLVLEVAELVGSLRC